MASSSLEPVVPSDPPLASEPAPEPSWAPAQVAFEGEDCQTPSLALEEDGTAHLAASCGGAIVYAWRRPDDAWRVAIIAGTNEHWALDPHLAIDRGTLYLAYSEVRPDPSCGGAVGTPAGTYVRTRDLPDGRWGVGGLLMGFGNERLTSFRVRHAVKHGSVVTPEGGGVYFRAPGLNGGEDDRNLLGSTGPSSVRVANDGTARIAYETSGAIRYAIGAETLRWTDIPETEGGLNPQLVLGSNDEAYVLWTRDSQGRGCASLEPRPEDGTYLSTDSDGAWTTVRITGDVGPNSLTMDPGSGTVHVLVVGRGVTYYNDRRGEWSLGTTLESDVWRPGVLRLDPRTGSPVVAYVRSIDETWTGVVVRTGSG